MGTNITGIGNANAIGFKSRVTGGAYFPPELKDALVGVWSAYGKSNDSTNRNIIKNKIKDKGGDFVISNAAFKLNSGFGKYSADFESFDWTTDISQKQHNKATISLNGRLCNHTAIEIDEMKVNIIGNVTELIYWYIANPDDTTRSEIRLTSGINTLPKSYAKDDGQTYNIGFAYISGDSEITIEQIPSFEGAFVTDGIDDLITSTKTVQEMLGGSNEITVVSMAHFIKGESNAPEICRINQIRRDTRSIRNSISKIGKSGIFGYTYKNGVTTINNILGDKNDCTAEGNLDGIVAPFSVEGYYYNNNSNPLELCSIAWYWTIIANKVLITDQINQVIAYFNLDRTLKPDILCNVKKQGITNENHAEFGDKLIDFSGNGRDIQLTNIAWKGDSGIGKYEVDFLDSSIWNSSNSTITSSKIDCKNAISHIMLLYYSVGSKEYPDIPSFKVIKTGADIDYSYIDETGSPKSVRIVDGVNVLPASHNTLYSGSGRFCGFGNPGMGNSVTITQIPSHAGGLCLDGINDFGKVTGMPIYKDYTFIADRQIITNDDSGEIVASKSESSTDVAKQGAFIFEYLSTNAISTWSYYKNNSLVANSDSNRNISYQSKYSYNGKALEIGEGKDSDKLWIGTIRDNDERFANIAIYSLMSFPYSMSEFLIERQLKKHKLGTLYPDMVEFRPVIKANANYNIFYTALLPLTGIVWEKINIGDYIPVGRRVAIQLSFDNEASELVSAISSQLGNISITKNSNNKGYTIFGDILKNKSPQKINITIDEYIRYEDIVQPYPSFVKLENLDRTHTYTWGDKLRIGDTIRYNSSKNLLEGAYTLRGQLECNGVYVFDNNQQIVVTKEMVFAWSHSPVWTIGNSAPKCVFSPSKLRIPNSSYKYLGYIPDISGNGNNGTFTNFAFSGMSGADGYPYDYKSTSDFVAHASNAVLVNSETVKFINVLTQTSFYYKGTSYKGKIKVTGITRAIASGKVRYLDIYSNSPTNNDRVIIDKDGIYDVNIETEDAIDIFFYLTPIVSGTTALDEPVYLEQVGNYEGSICFDGIDDYIDIPSLSIGGKQVLMKTNWLKSPTLLYDQRASGSFAILTTKEDDATNPRIAYQARNQDGKTYIDGIENNYIETYSLKGITHNITVTNPSAGSGVVPVIGANTGKSSSFAKMALYDFMLFDEVSTNEEIKQLNDIVGIEGGYVQKPPYYWDAYGKTNSDDDRDTIQQRGIAVGDYDLTNYNHAYNKMSGYGGYKFAKFDNTIEWFAEDSSMVVNRNGYLITLKKVPNVAFWRFRNTTLKSLDNPLTFKVKCNKPIDVIFQVKFAKNNDVSIGYNYNIKEVTLVPNESTTIIVPSVSVSDIPEATSILFINVLFDNTSLSDNEEYTVEMLPLYPNGLVYDGVDDYSENTSIPAFTDYTYIIKYEDFNNPNTGSCIQRKGSIKAGGGAFVQDHIYRGTKYQYNFGISSNIHKDDSIAFCTKTNYNGTAIPSGNNTDDTGFTIGKFDGYRKMVFYKEMLYPRTVNMLTINMIKNMMVEDGIIDIQGKLFTDKFTGDFNLDFNKDFLIGN